jgi:hypothetical protein
MDRAVLGEKAGRLALRDFFPNYTFKQESGMESRETEAVAIKIQ